MRIFLRRESSHRYICHFEEELAADASRPPSEPTGRLQRLKARLVDQYQRLEKKRPMAERLTARMRKLESVEVIYPDELSEAKARTIFFDFLARQAQHERTWKKWDVVLACLGAPLFVLPGPNIWFYYPAVRALGHHYAESGCKKFLDAGRTSHPALQIRFTPESKLHG